MLRFVVLHRAVQLRVWWDSRLAHGRDRGDVPGWVLITVMTAGLVSALWIVAQSQLSDLFQRAINGVTGP